MVRWRESVARISAIFSSKSCTVTYLATTTNHARCRLNCCGQRSTQELKRVTYIGTWRSLHQRVSWKQVLLRLLWWLLCCCCFSVFCDLFSFCWRWCYVWSAFLFVCLFRGRFRVVHFTLFHSIPEGKTTFGSDKTFLGLGKRFFPWLTAYLYESHNKLIIFNIFIVKCN